LKTFFKIYKDALKLALKKDIIFISSSLAFITILNLIPTMALSISLFKKSGQMKDIFDTKIAPFLTQNFAPGFSDEILDYLNKSMDLINTGKLGSWGILIQIFTIMLLFSRIEKVMNTIWDIPESRAKRKKLMTYPLLFIFAPLFTISLILLSSIAHNALQPLLALLTSTSLFALLYYFLPNTKVSKKAAFYGGLTSGVLFEGLKIGFVKISGQLGNYHAIYGSLAKLPLFLVWLQMSWAFVLFGGFVGASIRRHQKNKAIS
jgi:membrane protein